MAWQTLEATARGGMPPNPEPALRIITRRSGYLNVAARRALFGDKPLGAIWFQEDDETGGFSVRVDHDHEGDASPVSKSGRVTVTALTSAVDGPIPVTLQLAPCGEPGRLIIVGVKP